MAPGRGGLAAGAVLLALVAGACATRAVTPIGAGGRPFAPESGERALWAEAAGEEERLAQRASVDGDPALAAYVGTIGGRVMPPEALAAGGPGVRVTVLRDPTLNAFAMPDARLYVHTGLLSALENEAQLAAVLAREVAHVTLRHALRLQRERRSPGRAGESAALFGLAALSGMHAAGEADAAVLSATAGVVIGGRLRLAAIASIAGYGRDLEREADAAGIERMMRAGYDPREAARLFARLRDEARERSALEAFRHGNVAWLEERAGTARELAARWYTPSTDAGLVTVTDEFDARMRVVVRDNAVLDLRAGRFALAGQQLDRVLAATPRDPLAHLAAGDLYRLQSQRARNGAERTGDMARARASYERAAELDRAFAAPFRQLGLLYFQQKDAARAREAFRTYLALDPTAADARRIEEYLGELNR